MLGFGSCFEGITQFPYGIMGRCETEGGGKGTPKFGTHIWRLHGFLWVVTPAPWIYVP